jgi:hypothetical protein
MYLCFRVFPIKSKHDRWFAKLSSQEKNVIMLWMSEELNSGNFPDAGDFPPDWIFYAYHNFPRKRATDV